jgi:hypothetical protein
VVDKIIIHTQQDMSSLISLKWGFFYALVTRSGAGAPPFPGSRGMDLTIHLKYDRFAPINQQRRRNMSTMTVGSEYTTSVSGVTGTIKEIHEKPSGLTVLLLDVNGADRWTTAK